MTYTVVIASYKYGHLASHCIETVLSQTKKFDKILFVDDGVGDCNHLPKMYPDIEYTFREENMGTAKKFQDMLLKVSTDRCMFLGADNWLRSDTLEILSKFDTDIVTYDIIVTGELKNDIHQNYSKHMTDYYGDYKWDRQYQHHGSMMYNTKLAQSCGYEHRGHHSNEDMVLWEKMNRKGATISYINEGLLFYRRHKENFNKY